MYQHNLSRGAYRLVFWVRNYYPDGGLLKHGRDGWTKLAMNELCYTQPMLSKIANELVSIGFLKKTVGGFKYAL